MNQAAHVVDELQGYIPSRALDLSDERFGELTVLKPIAHDQLGVHWLCQCDCGRLAVRTAAKLRSSVKRGHVPMCSACLAELNSGRFVERRSARHDQFLLDYYQYGSLWGENAEINLEHRIREDLRGHEIECPEPEESAALPLVVQDPESSSSSTPQRAAYFFELSGRAWECELCQEGFSEGHGCSACLKVVCGNCARLELHWCRESNKLEWFSTHTEERRRQLPTGEPLRGRKFASKLDDEERVALVRKFKEDKEIERQVHERVREDQRRLNWDYALDTRFVKKAVRDLKKQKLAATRQERKVEIDRRVQEASRKILEKKKKKHEKALEKWASGKLSERGSLDPMTATAIPVPARLTGTMRLVVNVTGYIEVFATMPEEWELYDSNRPIKTYFRVFYANAKTFDSQVLVREKKDWMLVFVNDTDKVQSFQFELWPPDKPEAAGLKWLT